MSEIRVKGLSELERFLQELPGKLQNNVMRGAMAAAARVVRDRARLMAPAAPPSKTNEQRYHDYAGALRDSIKVSSTKVDTANGQVVAKLTVGGKNKRTGADVYYAYMIEFTGAAPHKISARGGKYVLINGGHPLASVMHPGFSPKPFLRPALDAAAADAVIAAGNYTKKRLATKEGLNTADIAIEVDG